MVDWQLTHSFTIRDIIDTAWGTKKKAHKKEALAPRPPPPPEDPYSKESLAFNPIGQDHTRTRFWVADSEHALVRPFDTSCQLLHLPDSPRMWTSTNPWKVTSLFNSICETRADYLAAIDILRASAPPEIEFTSETEVFGKRPHRDISHWQLIFALELRVDVIDQELKVCSSLAHKPLHIADSAKRVEEARQTQAQEIVDIQHTTELEEVDELLEPATHSKDTMAIDEEEPVTEEEPVKDEGSVSDIIHLEVMHHRLGTRASRLRNPKSPILNWMHLTLTLMLTMTMKKSTSWRTTTTTTISKMRTLNIYWLSSPQ